MANDLSDLDHLSPASTDLVSSGDDKIRETRQKLKNWATQDLGNASGEHYNDGPHRFIAGNGTPPTFSGLPASGHVGRIAIDSTNKHILRDDGTTWRLVPAVSLYMNVSAGPTAPAVGAGYNTLVTVSPTMHAGADALIFFSTSWTPPAAVQQLGLVVEVNGSVVALQPTEVLSAYSNGVAAVFNITSMFRWTGAYIVGGNTFSLRARVGSGSPGACSSNFLNIAIL